MIDGTDVLCLMILEFMVVSVFWVLVLRPKSKKQIVTDLITRDLIEKKDKSEETQKRLTYTVQGSSGKADFDDLRKALCFLKSGAGGQYSYLENNETKRSVAYYKKQNVDVKAHIGVYPINRDHMEYIEAEKILKEGKK